MNPALVDRLVNAVMYEGYLLYPYRPSVKNTRRWTFGGLYPGAYAATHSGDASDLHCECLLEATAETTLQVEIRYLQVVERVVGQLESPLAALPSGEPAYEPVDSLDIDGETFSSWQEGEERRVVLEPIALAELATQPRQRGFTAPGGRAIVPLRNFEGLIVGVQVRTQQALQGVIELSAQELDKHLHRVTLQVRNLTPLSAAAPRNLAEASACMSTHAVLCAAEGAFLSLTDPPAAYREPAAACRNVGCWPVLVGDEGDRDCLLASPIILPDYPQIAEESPGDLFDATEIDEILSLRVMTLTDDEKRRVAATDDRARALLERTETLAREQLMSLHGTMRDVHPSTE